MKENYYIQAAIEIGEIENTVGYGFENNKIVSPDGTLVDITPAIETKAQYLSDLKFVRQCRNSLISETDWVANPDYPQTDFKTSMLLYRQQLRDVTDQVIEGQPLNITWPQDPRVI